MNVYTYYTESFKPLLDLFTKSTEHLTDFHLFPVLLSDNVEYLGGQTGNEKFLEMLTGKIQLVEQSIKENTGSNVLYIDCDIVFNKKKADFVRQLGSLLEDNDFLFQMDDNSGMSAGINSGFIAAKASEKAHKFFKDYVQFCLDLPPSQRLAGYPQLEINDWFLKKAKMAGITWDLLPLSCFGVDSYESYFYHAINTHDKLAKLSQVDFSC